MESWCNLQAILHDREVSILSTNKGEEILLEIKERLSSEKWQYEAEQMHDNLIKKRETPSKQENYANEIGKELKQNKGASVLQEVYKSQNIFLRCIVIEKHLKDEA